MERKPPQIYLCLINVFILHGIIVTSTDQLQMRQTNVMCHFDETTVFIMFQCPSDELLSDLPVANVPANLYDTIEHLEVIGTNSSVPGPLTAIPISICNFTRLKFLYLSNHQINSSLLNSPFPCLTELETIDLSKNYLTEVPVSWISQMSNLKKIDLSHNQIHSIPSAMFSNLSNIEELLLSNNRLITFELWLIQVKGIIDYSNNPVTRFSNDYDCSLLNDQSTITQRILFSNHVTHIDIDDGLFEMYNRCGEINATYPPVLMNAIERINDNNRDLFEWDCSCKFYYLQSYLVSKGANNTFSTCKGPHGESITYDEKCNYQSSFNGENLRTQLCKLDDWVSRDLDLLKNCTELEECLSIMFNELMMIKLLNKKAAFKFINQLDQFSNKLDNLTEVQEITPSIQTDLQNITTKIESLLESINITINVTYNSIAILSLTKNHSIYSYSQTIGINSLLSYSTNMDINGATTTISIDESSIDNLTSTDIYTFYFLPSVYFQHAQNDQRKIIISPIVGVHLPNRFPRLINISFTNITHSLGSYSCEFWQAGNWNTSGCTHFEDSKSHRHFCSCDHTTSFALIFIPNKSIPQAYIPSITIAVLSIVCFCISIILSIYRQSTSFRHLSIGNIFSLLNSIVLFILLTVILIRGYQSSKIQSNTNNICSVSERNLAISTYFFLILTFASRTLLGICYFLAIFFHFIFIQYTSLSNKWLYVSLILIILIALIPTIIIRIILNQWTNLFVRYDGDICWLHTSMIFRFIAIPIFIFISLNFLIIFVITTRLFQFVIGRKKAQTSEKRFNISLLIWLSLCVSLGIAWIIGPFLQVISEDNNQSARTIIQWIFTFFIGLEGVWVLIVHVIFYLNQKRNMTKKQQKNLKKINKSDL
ncbi:hypothetical protein I4U23_030040 [Adineta vaga]|nr:hypothetical protein I4U23_030040 [Adineta vaga]